MKVTKQAFWASTGFAFNGAHTRRERFASLSWEGPFEHSPKEEAVCLDSAWKFYLEPEHFFF